MGATSLPRGSDFAEAVVETVREPLLVLDDRQRVVLVNRAFCQRFEVAQGEVVGRPFHEPGDGLLDVPELRTLLEEVLPRDREVVDFEIVRERPGERPRLLLVSARQVRLRGDSTPHVLVALDDVTEHRRALEEARTHALAAREHAAALERSNRELERFAYVASHDLQQPLRMVSGYLSLLERRHGDRLDGESREFLELALEGGRRMKEMIDDLLAYSRLGRRSPDREAVALGEVLACVRRELAQRIEDEGAELVVGELPVVTGDAEMLVRLFGNLVENALKYRGDAPPRIEVRAQAGGSGEDWVVTVADDGPGIGPGQEERIFEIFRQGRAEDRERGTGIGLAVCRTIVEAHGGTIEAGASDRGGAELRVALPARDDAAGPGRARRDATDT